MDVVEAMRRDVYFQHTRPDHETSASMIWNKIIAGDMIYLPKVAGLGGFGSASAAGGGGGGPAPRHNPEKVGTLHDTIRVPFCHAAASANNVSGEILRV